MKNIIEKFRQAIVVLGVDAPDVIHDNDAIHRFSKTDYRTMIPDDMYCIPMAFRLARLVAGLPA